MNYLYHWVPKNMQGDTLYPLNLLKEEYPELYTDYAKNYEGREKVMEQFIPTLNCLWNDVLHLSAVHPQVVKDALTEAGMQGDLKIACYEIDPHLLDQEKTTVYFDTASGADKMKEDNFVPFNPNETEKYSSLPQETKDYYKEIYSKGGRPLVFHKVVHILYKGTINIKGLSVIEV